MSIKLVGCQSYLPKNILTNHDLSTMVETSEEWILKRTGIKERCISDATESVLDLAVKAAKPLMDKKIDALIVATYSAEERMPNLASKVINAIDLPGIPAFDINVACSGFVYGMTIAKTLLDSNKFSNIMVIGVDKNSKHIDWTDRNTCCLFGDGAGAIILSKCEENKVFDFHLGCDTTYCDDLKTVKNTLGDEYLEMNGKKVFKLAVSYGETLLKKAIEKLDGELPDFIIFHQANKRIIDSIMNDYDIPKEKISYALEYHGNTSAASIPLALDLAIKNNDVTPGDKVLMIAFGAGFSWGSILFEY